MTSVSWVFGQAGWLWFPGANSCPLGVCNLEGMEGWWGLDWWCVCLWEFCQDAANAFEALIFLDCFLINSRICKLPSTDSLLVVAGTVFPLYWSVFSERGLWVSIFFPSFAVWFPVHSSSVTRCTLPSAATCMYLMYLEQFTLNKVWSCFSLSQVWGKKKLLSSIVTLILHVMVILLCDFFLKGLISWDKISMSRKL